MKLSPREFDPTDRAILELLQEDCKQPLATIGGKVGLSAPAVVERIHKLEEAGVVTSYVALLDARKLGMDVAAFIAVKADSQRVQGPLESRLGALEEVLECHHVTGAHSFLLKVRTRNMEALENLIDRIRALEGITHTETHIVLSTYAEGPRLPLAGSPEFRARSSRRSASQRARRSST